MKCINKLINTFKMEVFTQFLIILYNLWVTSGSFDLEFQYLLYILTFTPNKEW